MIWILGTVVWFICGLGGYFIARAAFRRNGRDYKYVQAWSSTDSMINVVFILGGPMNLLASIAFYLTSN